MRLKLSVLAIATIFLLASCKKDSKSSSDYKCASCVTTAEANAANNSSSKGIYKGVVIGSSGTIKFDIMNNGSSIKAYLTIDGTSVELVSAVTWNGSQPYVAPFTGTLNGQPVSITFSVGTDGSNAVVLTASIPNHPNATFIIVKENSSALIECFEGTYHSTAPEDGTWNVVLSRQAGLWGGISRENGHSETQDEEGSIVGNQIQMDGQNIGTIDGDEINGSFKDSNSKTVTIKGKRTL